MFPAPWLFPAHGWSINQINVDFNSGVAVHGSKSGQVTAAEENDRDPERSLT
jgi:hypothetical protein